MAKINNILSFSIKFQNGLDRNFEYDPLYRVISGDGRESNTQNQNDYLYSDAPAPGSPNANNVRAYTRKYAFDKLGNIQQLKQLGSNGFTRNFTYNAGHNTLQKIETAAPSLLEDFTYDACGNQLTAGTTRNYVWNAGNQLVTYYNQVESADPTIFAQYDYSGMNRVSKLVKTGTSANPIYERTIYIDGIFEYHILENGGTYEKNYVHIMDDQSRIAMVRIGTPFPDDIADEVVYNLEDQIGSSAIRLNNNGGIIDKEEYYPFGDSSFRTFTKKRYRYVGKEKDLESGLYYYGARYYAAWTCRFISVDPLASDYPFYTPYNYAGNKPIGKVDIDGMQEEGAEPVNGGGKQQSGDDKIYYQGILPEFTVTGVRIITAGEAARIADNVYGGPDVAKLINGWRKSEVQIPGVEFNNTETGFKSALYERTNSEGVTQYAYAFAGTDTDNWTELAKDAKEDANQALGKDSPQYEQAARNARTISNALTGRNLTFVGHSLGGGLASAAALATGKNAITFNAAGLHPNTKAANDLNMQAKIDAYVVRGEIVDLSQSALGLTAEGTRHELKAGYMIQIWGTSLDDTYRLYQRGKNHLMGTVIQKMEQQKIR